MSDEKYNLERYKSPPPQAPEPKLLAIRHNTATNSSYLWVRYGEVVRTVTSDKGYSIDYDVNGWIIGINVVLDKVYDAPSVNHIPTYIWQLAFPEQVIEAAPAPAPRPPINPPPRYVYADEEDSGEWGGDYPTREAAVEAARNNGEDYPFGFFTAEYRDATLRDVYPGGIAFHLIDNLGSEPAIEYDDPEAEFSRKAYDLVIKPALGGKDTASLRSLEIMLREAFMEWAADHLPRPDWYYVIDIEHHDAVEGVPSKDPLNDSEDT